MTRLKIGDRIHIIHKGEIEQQTYTILDILEDYGDSSYWLAGESGHMVLESETPETVFEKIGTVEEFEKLITEAGSTLQHYQTTKF
ncbi:MAG: hypothetical protein ACREBB_10940 [Nitrosotalea sp.]